ncbi:DNA polymerase III subunit delta' [Thalassolituus sp.]|uniref:DNA polymerase III subunit delta' n=1 Tax=Thalassolituus sp. TaxID=2030822 RepID=UPI003515878E
MALYPWQNTIWQNLVKRHAKSGLPHALLLTSTKGIGKHELTRTIARWLLCQSESKQHGDVSSCQCHSCQLWEAGSHPDFMLCQPEDNSRQIRIDNVRKVNELIFQTPQISACQVVILRPAEVMNTNAANALLKTLEEPPGESYILLETERFGSVLPTIRSRCQRMTLPVPSREESIDWLAQQGVSQQDAVLALTRNGNAPVAAAEWLSSGTGAKQEKWAQELVQWTTHQLPLDKVASAWAKLEFQDVIQWFYQISCDALKAACGAPSVHLQFAEPVTELQARSVADTQLLITFQKKVQNMLGQLLSGASHYNKTLTTEALLLEWQALNTVTAGVKE